MTKKSFILVLGPQGSGKSTQAVSLAEYIDYKFISTGKLLRQLERERNPIGLKLAEYWVKGDLVPDDLIDEVVLSVFEKENVQGFVVDGYPRNERQLKTLLSFLELNDWLLRQVFYLEVSEEESMKRLLLRAQSEHRLDETENAIQKRIAIYHKETEPLLRKYEEMMILTRINGERSIEDIQADIQSKIINK